MAVTYTHNRTGQAVTDRWAVLHKWVFDDTGTVNASGDTADIGGHTDVLVRIVSSGANFDGGTLTWQGSVDGTDWFTLTDIDTADAAQTAATDYGYVIREAPKYIRPTLSGSTAPALTAYAYATAPALR